MIPVPHPIPEPDDFDEKCRQAGKEWLKEAGLKQTLAPDVLAAKEEIEAARAAKRDHLSALRQRRRTGRAPVLTPAGTPAQRLEVLRKTAIRKVFTSTFRQPAHGETKVVLTDDPAKVGVTQTPYDDWNVYAKSYRHDPARCLDTVVTVRLRWRTRVERRGLAVLNGMMTLDAILVGVEANDVRLLYATWAAQGRGNSINVVNGFIAISNGVSYHADIAESALSGLKRKISRAQPSCTQHNALVGDLKTPPEGTQ